MIKAHYEKIERMVIEKLSKIGFGNAKLTISFHELDAIFLEAEKELNIYIFKDTNEEFIEANKQLLSYNYFKQKPQISFRFFVYKEWKKSYNKLEVL